MKSIYDFMSKTCPWAPLKLTHRPPQQNWSGSFVGERSCSCSLQRGELEFPALKSSFPSHSALQVPSDGTAGGASTICLHCMCSPCDALQWEGRLVFAGRCCSCCCLCSSWAGPEQLLGTAGRAPCAQQGALQRGSVPGKGQGHRTAPQLSAESWTDCLHHHTALDPECCLLGLVANAQTVPRLWGKSSVPISQDRIFQIM